MILQEFRHVDRVAGPGNRAGDARPATAVQKGVDVRVARAIPQDFGQRPVGDKVCCGNPLGVLLEQVEQRVVHFTDGDDHGPPDAEMLHQGENLGAAADGGGDHLDDHSPLSDPLPRVCGSPLSACRASFVRRSTRVD